MRIDSFGSVLEDLVLKPITKVEYDVICVRFDGVGEEVNFKMNADLTQILQAESELPRHDEDLDGVSGDEMGCVRH